MKYLKALAMLIADEPALAVGVVVASLNLLAGYGVPVGGQHALDIKALVETAVILAGALLVRSQVTPVSTLGIVPPLAATTPEPPAATPPAPAA